MNDFCFPDGKPSGWETLQALYDRHHEDYLRRVRGLGAGADWGRGIDFLGSLPIVRLANAVGTHSRMVLAGDRTSSNTGRADTPIESEPAREALLAVIDRYQHNIRQIRASANAYGIVPLFVWQPVPTYKYDLRYHAFAPQRIPCLIDAGLGYRHMAERVFLSPPDENFVWSADIQEGATENLYVDAAHYTAPFSQRIAEFLADSIMRRLAGSP